MNWFKNKKRFFLLLIITVVVIGGYGCKERNKLEKTDTLRFQYIESSGKIYSIDSICTQRKIIAGLPETRQMKIVDIIPNNESRVVPVTPITEKAATPDMLAQDDPGIVAGDSLKIFGKYVFTRSPERVEINDVFFNSDVKYSFRYYSKIQGLPHDDISCFMEDEEGHIWIGTKGGGLCRYDGQSFSTYNKNNGLKSLSISKILQGRNSEIWISMVNGGVAKLDGIHTVQYSKENGLLSDDIISMAQDSEGRIWLAYLFGGLSCIEDTIIRHFGPKQGDQMLEILDMKSDDEGNVWMASAKHGLMKFDGKSFYVYTVGGVTYDNNIFSIYIDGKDFWLAVFDKGIARFDGEKFYYYYDMAEVPINNVSCISKDNKGNLWIGTWEKGLLSLSDGNFKTYSKVQGLNNNYIQALLGDSKGILWIANWYGGVTQYLGSVFTHYMPKTGFNQGITQIIHSGDHKQWISSIDGGLMSYDGKKFTQYAFSKRKDMPDFVVSMIKSSDGKLWMGANTEGLFCFDGNDMLNYPIDRNADYVPVNSLFEDREKNIWFVVNLNEIVKFNGKEFSFYKIDSIGPDVFMNNILQDSKGKIWISSWGGGVYCMDGKTITHFSADDGLRSNFVYTCYEDRFGQMWFGVEGIGLMMYDGQGFLNFSDQDGLVDNYPLSIIQDSKGNLIIGGRMGFSILPQKNLQLIANFSATKEIGSIDSLRDDIFRKLTFSDGFFGIGCNREVISEDNKGRIWIGANDRITVFAPDEIEVDTVGPKIEITKIMLFNEDIYWPHLLWKQDTSLVLSNQVALKDFRFDSISPWHLVPYNLELSHKNNFIRFDFIGATSLSPDKVMYSYMLDGHDAGWQKPSPNGLATYGNLSPGKYIFRVKAINAQGYWGNECEYSFVIKTPWWRTWWAFVVYFFVSMASFASFVKIRERSLILKNKLLDKEVEVAKKTIEFKQNIIANVSHEIRTPLAGVIGLTDMLGRTELNELQQNYLVALKQSGENLNEIINQILDYSNIEAGKVELKNETFSLADVFNYAENLFLSLPKKEKLAFSSSIDNRIPHKLLSDKGRINRILQNMLSNAVKYTEKGSVSVGAVLIDPADGALFKNQPIVVKVVVNDTGVGIKKEMLENLFMPFSQVEYKDTRNADSAGLSLAICKNLAELLGGSVGVSSIEGAGSSFWFTFRAFAASQDDDPIVVDHNEKSGELSPLKILYVEDKKVNQMVIKLMLESAGHTVALAANGQIALDMFKPGLFDAILMDIQMPVMDGLTATQKLKEQYRDVPPIIGISANAFKGDREKYMGIGMDEFVTKPVDEAFLFEILRKLCAKV